MSVPGPHGLSDDDMFFVTLIRRRCAAEFKLPIDHAFFSAHYRTNEPADVAILRVFREEMSAQRARFRVEIDYEVVIEAMVYG